MDIEYRKKVPLYIGFGLILQFFYGGISAIHNKSDIIIIIEALSLFIGLILFLIGCWKLAKGKGYSGFLGFLLAFFLNIVGLIILAILPDKTETEKK